jgi:HlyD family secretion protein
MKTPNEKYIELKDMSDSREVLSEKPRRFISYFVYFLILMILIALVWAILGRIDYYIKAGGEVRPNETVSVIRNTVTGRVLEVNLSEGQRVNKGDVLFVMDVETHINTAVILERQLETITLEMRNLEKFRESVISNENLFDIDNPDETDYYFRFQKHITDRDTALEQLRNANLDFERIFSDAIISEENALGNSRRMRDEINELNLLLRSIEQGENLIPVSNSVRHGSFIDYQINVERYTLLINTHKAQEERAEALYAVGGVSKNQLETAQNDLTAIILERDRYVNEFLININNNIENLNKNIIELESVIQSASLVMGFYSDRGFSEELIIEKSKLDALAHITDMLFNFQSNSDALQMDLDSLRLSISEASIISPIDGVVSLATEINTGDFLQGGMEIATIIPDASGELRIILAITNADIADISVGQPVHFRFPALPFRDYGEIQGHITQISVDSRNDNYGQSYFIVEAEMNNNVLYGRNGEPEYIRIGMAVEARVITRNTRIIHWVLEKLDFINN